VISELKAMLAGIDADYADIRYEVKHETKITLSGRELTELSASSTDGHVVRVLKDGGFAAVAFTRPQDAGRAVARALANAQLFANRAAAPVALAETEVVIATVKPELDEDPAQVPLNEKLAVLRTYNDIPLGNDWVATTSLAYAEVSRQKAFVSTEGSEIQEDLVTVRISGSIVARDGPLTQTVRVGFGGSDGFGRLRQRHDHVEQRTGIAVDLLRAEPVTAGTYRVILDPHLGGVFTHEAFGHFSEADLIEDAPTMRAKMRLGAKLGVPILNIRDDPTLAHQLGHYVYDDEGVRARRTHLMRDGVLVGRLHSRRTAAAFGEPLTGHCVAEDYRYAPIIRMGCIFIEPGEAKLEDLMSELGDGLYLAQPMGGQTSGQNFTFGANYGFVVKGGQRRQMVRDINLSGDLYRTLEHIEAIGDDLRLGEIGGCGKGQTNIRSCFGAPHTLIDGVVIGGR
jgi:TldD protein